MSILTDIWEGVRTTLIGMKITVPYIWKKPVTVMYPHERMELPERARNRLYVNMDDCIGCDQCSRACPVNCITIETAKAVDGDSPGVTSNGKKKALWVTRFDIDIAKCCYCGLCTFPCPTECIKMTDVFEFSEQERNNLIYNYVTLTPEEIQEKIRKSGQADDDIAAKKTAAKGGAGAAAPAAEPAKAAAPKTPAVPVPAAIAGDPEKAAKFAELQAKMAAAKAKREAEAPAAAAAPAAAPAPAEAPPAEAAPKPKPAPAAAPSGDDPAAAARIAAMKAKIAELKAQKGE